MLVRIHCAGGGGDGVLHDPPDEAARTHGDLMTLSWFVLCVVCVTGAALAGVLMGMVWDRLRRK
jgi:hypothetical protein